jgi:hypothetical protein
MSEWTKVVTEPLGLTAFALFLIFSYLGKVNRGDKRRWLSPVAFTCAVATLIGGLVLAYIQLPKHVESPHLTVNTPDPAAGQTNPVRQTSHGPGSPNVQGVQGDVTVTVDQSTGRTEQKKVPEKKTKP